MSTLKVDAIRHNSATSDAITTAADGTCTAKLTSIGGGGLSHRNIIVNGAMNVAQHGTSQSTTGGSSARCVDRFFAGNPTGSQVQTASQEVDGPVGFYNSLKVTCTTNNTSITTSVGDQAKIEYRIEGTDLAYVQLGTSNAQTLSVSFYVKSNKTGNSAIGLINQNNNRSFVHQFTIASANTWQRVSFPVVGDTTGTWSKDTSIGMRMRWGTFGTNHQTSTFGAWQAGQFMATSNSPINFNSATGDYIQITGVQVEVGDTVTSFEHRSIGDELQRCRRYYQVLVDQADSNSEKSFAIACAYSSTSMHSIHLLSPEMRTTPTLDYTTGSSYYRAFNNNTSDYFDTFALVGNSHINAVDLMVSSGLSVTQGAAVLIRTSNNSSRIAFTAEL